jgi:YcaO cyclodehydratase, ATP-ad Mg2+-binding
MQPRHMAEAADLLESAGAEPFATIQGQTPPVLLLQFLGVAGPAGEIGLAPEERRQFARLLRMAARLDAVFPMHVPTAPGAAFFGARRLHFANGELAGSGKARPTDYAGLASSLTEAFCACIGEAAEHDAMFLRQRDLRLSPDGALPLLDEQLRAAGGIDAALILREAGDGARAPPRSSTGYAAGRTLSEAAMSALLECIERHAISLWFNGLRKPISLRVSNEAVQRITRLRGAAAPPCRLLRLPHDLAGAPVAAACSVSAGGGTAVGYGCALSVEQASQKAVRELCQGEFALHLESQASSANARAFTERSRMFAQNTSLFETADGDSDNAEPHSNLPGLCAAFGRRVRFVNLSLSENSVPVVCALADGVRDIASEFSPGQTGPL